MIPIENKNCSATLFRRHLFSKNCAVTMNPFFVCRDRERLGISFFVCSKNLKHFKTVLPEFCHDWMLEAVLKLKNMHKTWFLLLSLWHKVERQFLPYSPSIRFFFLGSRIKANKKFLYLSFIVLSFPKIFSYKYIHVLNMERVPFFYGFTFGWYSKCAS